MMKEQDQNELKKLSIAYQSGLEYDYVPEPKKAKEIKSDCRFANYYSLNEIKESLAEHQGSRPDEIASMIVDRIDKL